MPRERNLVLKDYDIGEWRYKELKAFCRQYPEKKAQAAALLGVRAAASDNDGMPRAKGGVSDPVARAAEKRERLLADVHMIDKCAGAIEGGRYAKAIILNVCYAMKFEAIAQELLPNSYRNSYFEARRKFFCLLDRERGATDGAMESGAGL